MFHEILPCYLLFINCASINSTQEEYATESCIHNAAQHFKDKMAGQCCLAVTDDILQYGPQVWSFVGAIVFSEKTPRS